jgi:hypothetical protein
MVHPCADTLSNGSLIPAGVPGATNLPAGASGVRAQSPAAPLCSGVTAVLEGGITPARDSSRQRTNRQLVPGDHDTPEQGLCPGLGIHTFTSASTRTKGEWGRITIKHIYREV